MVLFSLAGVTAAESPEQMGPPVEVVKELVLQCPPGDTPTVRGETEFPEAGRLRLMLSCLDFDAARMDGITGLRMANKKPLGPEDHVLRLSMKGLRPSVGVEVPVGGDSELMIVTVDGVNEVAYGFLPGLTPATAPSQHPVPQASPTSLVDGLNG